MSDPASQKTSVPTAFRIIAIIAATVFLFALFKIIYLLAISSLPFAELMPIVWRYIYLLAGSVVVFLAFFLMAATIDRHRRSMEPQSSPVPPSSPPTPHAPAPAIQATHIPAQAHMRELAAMRKSIEELRQSLEELPQRIARANPASSNGSGPSPNSNAAIQEILILLRELWDLALLDDERQLQRVEVLRQQRRSGFIAEADKLIARGDWSVAERAIAAFESDFGTSDEIAELKNRLTASRIRVEQTTLRDLNSRVDDLVAISSWDQALALTTRFVENFPNSAEGRELLDRLRHHRDSHVEITANRLYDEIKSYINNRRWRDALANAKRLMESFPGHRRAAMIRPQLATIRENAEIEQRHEQEARIQESIRKRDFVEAIELAEDLVQKFPHSPQAASLHELLPRLQELLQEDIEKQTAEAETDGAAAS